MTVEVTAHLSINLNGTWELIGFEPNSLTEVKEPSPKRQLSLYEIEPKAHGRREFGYEQRPIAKALNRAQENPRHYSNRPKHNNWGNTVRKIQECSVCGMGGVNKRTCLAHFNGGERIHRKTTGVF